MFSAYSHAASFSSGSGQMVVYGGKSLQSFFGIPRFGVGT
jgi:hypothetical protein